LIEFVVFAEDAGNPKFKGNASVIMHVLGKLNKYFARMFFILFKERTSCLRTFNQALSLNKYRKID